MLAAFPEMGQKGRKAGCLEFEKEKCKVSCTYLQLMATPKDKRKEDYP